MVHDARLIKHSGTVARLTAERTTPKECVPGL